MTSREAQIEQTARRMAREVGGAHGHAYPFPTCARIAVEMVEAMRFSAAEFVLKNGSHLGSVNLAEGIAALPITEEPTL